MTLGDSARPTAPGLVAGRSAGLVTTGWLPRWPLAALFVAFPLWWAMGLADVSWILIAGVMGLYLVRARAVKAPRGFGLWLLFLAWTAGSAVMLDGAGSAVGFAYRYAIYVAATIIALYAFNARRTLTERYVTGCLTVWWLTTVVGGYLGLLLPTTVVRTPMAYVLPQALVSNDLVNHMVVRRFAQFNPDSFLQVAPRPSAPFLYTNNWGNVYSLLLPFVIVYILQTRHLLRSRLLMLALPLSAVPAFLTLNRGMFIGIALALVYAAVRLALMRQFRAIGALLAMAVLGAVLYLVLPIQERLEGRLDSSAEATSNDTRASLYLQALELVPGSPLFGYGGPQQGDNLQAAPVGTQGQVWMLLVSHGPIATAAYVMWFLAAWFLSRRRRDPMGIACQAVLVVGSVELLYYGMVPNGLPLMMLAAAMALRGPDAPVRVASHSLTRPALAAHPRN